MRRRPASGLLGGMVELPGTPWREEAWDWQEALAFALRRPLHGGRPASSGMDCTHFELALEIYVARVDTMEGDGFPWPTAGLRKLALPSVMRKCVKVATAAESLEKL